MNSIKNKENIPSLRNIFKEDLRLLIDSVCVGIFAGALGITYRILITYSNKVVHFFLKLINQNGINILYLIIFLIIVGFLAGLFSKIEPYSAGSGIPQVTAEVQDQLSQNPLRVLFCKIFGGFFASLGGLSLGREGPSIQLGAMSGKLVSNIFKRDKDTEKTLLTSGASAGLAVAFNAPLAGVLFSLEEVHKKFSKPLILSCVVASFVSDILTQIVFSSKPIFNFPHAGKINFNMYIYIAILGVILGILGTAYNLLMKGCFTFYKKTCKNPLFRPEIAMALSLVMFIVFPIVLTSGHNLVEKLLYTSYGLIFLIILYFIKMLFSIMSFTSGVSGGIFLPILVQGSILGAIASNFVGKENLGLFIVLSMAAYLTAIVRSPLTSMVLIFEMTASLSLFLPLGICCIMAYFTANVLGTLPVYEYLLERLQNSKK